jgi:hypothetical protein
MTAIPSTVIAAPPTARSRSHASGPRVARWFHRVFAALCAVAWASLAAQIVVLVGARGLLPAARAGDAPFLAYPTLFRWIPPTDTVLVAGCWLGFALSLIAAAGLGPRLIAALQIPLYLSYAVVCRDFLGFQWDNLLLECALLAAFLPRDRPAPLVHFLFRFLAFKLYFESGIAKWQSHLGDWHDGSAMTYYYETAPLPAPLAWTAHHLPAWWHAFESRATLALELIAPLAFFVPSRRVRLAAAVLLTGFQLVNLATANYGFFVPLALALHLFLLPETPRPSPPPPPRARRAAVAVFAAAYLSLSTLDAVVTFFDPGRAVARATRPLRRLVAPFRVVNSYHLFGHITRERIEPEFAVSTDGDSFVAAHLRYKPGPPDRRPPLVAPHQPRVDFLLWFYGLSYARGTPEYVVNLVRRLCAEPRAVQPLFATALPDAPQAVEVRLRDTRFATPEERARGRWWRGAPRAVLGPVRCADLPAQR